MPGQAKTRSTNTEPVMNAASNSADTVIGCISALRNAWRMITAAPLTPLARASFTYSESSTSSMEERVSRRYVAHGSNANTSAGSMKCCACTQRLAVEGALVPTGTHCK